MLALANILNDEMMEESLTIDDPPSANVELEPEKIDDGKNGGHSFHCDLYDTELVHKIAQGFIPGLATACVDDTSGDIFRTPSSVAAEVRKEMVEYVTQRSQNFVAESVILGGQDGQVSDHPYDIISELVDDFASSKRNLFSRVSGWLLSEKREDNIDDFVQEMEINGFWLVDKRETIAQNLLKNVDLKNEHHCSLKFNTLEELEAHVAECGYKSTGCIYEGCNVVLCASQVDKHDAFCPFKRIPCEQSCSDMIMRRDMDRHCITVCPMKLVSCPFYTVGCQSPVPHCKLEQHRSDDLHSHMLFVLQIIHKETSGEDLKRRLEKLKDASLSNNLAQARDVRSLTSTIKDLEAKLGPLEISRKQQENLDAEHGPEEVGSKAPKVVEPRPNDISNKPEEFVLKPAPKEVSQQSENLEARSEPKEVGTKPVKDLEAKPSSEEVSSSKIYEDVEARSVTVSGKAPTEQEAKQAAEELSTKPAEHLEAKQSPREVSSSKPHEDVEAILVGVDGQAPTGHDDKPAPEELSTEPAAKSAPREDSKSKSPEDVEARSVGMSGQAPTGHEAELEAKDLSTKTEEDLEAISSLKEVSSPKPLKDVEARSVGVSGQNPTGHEATQAPKELSTKPAEDLEAKPALKDVSSAKPPEAVEARPVEVRGEARVGHDGKLVSTEVRGKSPEELQTKAGTKVVSSKPPEELETQLGEKEVGIKPSKELETQVGTKEASNIPPQKLETNLGRNKVGSKRQEGYETQLETKDASSKPKEELDAELGTEETRNKPSAKEN